MYRYCGPFLFLASIPFFFTAIGGTAPFLTVAMLLAVLIGAELTTPRGGRANEDASAFPRLLPLAYIPLQLAVSVWALVEVSNPATPLASFASLVVAVGVTTGVFGVLAAHELVHGQNRLHLAIAAVLLSAMTYRHFRIAHVYGHHRFAATERDAATARLGEGFYAFLVRTLKGQLMEAWSFEERRRIRRRRNVFANRVAADAVVMSAIYATVLILFGVRGAAFLATESAVAIVVLELFNYIAHYGLLRRVGIEGRREQLDERHSWNSSNLVANLFVFNMGRHSDHHTTPSAPFPELTYIAGAPELPAGYAGSIVLALIPPLWRKIMDPAVERLASRQSLDMRPAA